MPALHWNICHFIVIIINNTICMESEQKNRKKIIHWQAYQGGIVFNKLLAMSKMQTPQFVCLGPVLLYIGLHTVVLFSWILCSFTNVSRHFYCCFLAETLKLGGCAINSIKGTDKAHTYTQAQTLNRRPRSSKKAFWWFKK